MIPFPLGLHPLFSNLPKPQPRPSDVLNKREDKYKVSTFRQSDHGSTFLTNLDTLRKEGLFCDISILVGSSVIPAHKVVLAGTMEYFKASLSWDTNKTEVNITDVDETTMRDLVTYAYSGQIDISEDNVIEVLTAADFFNIKPLYEFCIKHIEIYLTTSNCLKMFQFALFRGFTALERNSRNFVLMNFFEMSSKKEFLELPYNLILSFLKSDDIVVIQDGYVLPPVAQEEFILKVIYNYLELTKRRDRAIELLDCLKLHLLPENVLKNLESDSKLSTRSLRTNPKLKALLGKSRKAKKKLGKQIGPRDGRSKAGNAYRQKTNGPYGRLEFLETKVSEFSDQDKVGPFAYVTGMKMWFHRWEDRPILCGLKVFYSDGNVLMHGVDHKNSDDIYEFHLAEKERITKCNIWSYKKVYSLKFFCGSLSKYYGTYGASSMERPYSCHQRAPNPYTNYWGYLRAVGGHVINRNDVTFLSKLTFAWTFYDFESPPSQKYLLLEDDSYSNTSYSESDYDSPVFGFYSTDDDDDDDDDMW